jgi:hypothetical protein
MRGLLIDEPRTNVLLNILIDGIRYEHLLAFVIAAT